MAQRLPPFYQRLRFSTSLLSTVVLNLGVFGVGFKSVCSPGFNCHGCPWAVAACPVGVIAFASAMHTIPLYAIASVLLVAVVLGRLACSFLCPFGFLQDLLCRIPSRKFTLPRVSRYGKYVAFAGLVLLTPWFLGLQPAPFMSLDKPTVNKAGADTVSVELTARNLGTEPLRDPQVNLTYRARATGDILHTESHTFAGVTLLPGEKTKLPMLLIPNQLAAADLAVESPQASVSQKAPLELYYCRLCPSGTLTATIPTLFTTRESLLNWLERHWLRLSILGVFLCLMVFTSRPFCRLFCPLGAMYALTAPVALSRFDVKLDVCTNCKLCDRSCPVDLDVRRDAGSAECIACGDCIKACPESGISRRFGL